jgi:8-oxo-dGTP pyrophosphatase MutT (NUDIX family)
MPHIHEKIDFTVEVFIVHKNKVLLRMHEKYHIWCSVGGHIELDEDPIEAAHREVKEEVGLDITLAGKDVPKFNDENFTILMPPAYIGRHRTSPTHEHVVFVYFATSATDHIADSESEHERTETRWVTKEELQTMDLVPNIRFYAEEALKALAS